MDSSMIQRQIKLNASQLKPLYELYREYGEGRKYFVGDKNQAAVAVYNKSMKKLRKHLASLEAVQKALKKDLKEAYWQEHFAKTYEPLPHDEDDFLWLTQAEIVTKEGMPVPTWTDGVLYE